MQASLTLWQKYMQKSLVHTEEIFGFLIQPILWVVLFGVGMRGRYALASNGFFIDEWSLQRIGN